LKVGDLVSLDQGDWMREITIRELSDTRGPAPVAQTLYADTASSLAARDKAREQRIYSPDPAASIKGRPSKRDRRALERTRGSD
jgi:ribosome-associated heat shock protein Hsp15